MFYFLHTEFSSDASQLFVMQLSSKLNDAFHTPHSTSELMYEVLDETLRRAEMNHNITYGKFSSDQTVL